MVVKRTGNVGIGTTNPTHRLSVGGGIVATSSITANGGFYGDGSGLTNVTASNILDNTVTSAKIVAGTIVNADISSTAGISWSKIDKTGSSLVDLSTRSAGDLTSGNLDIARMPTGGDWGITSNLSIAGSTFVITTGGNIGIGTTNPGAKLEIVGRIKIVDGMQGEGKVLTSDAQGQATWRQVNISTNIPRGAIVMWSGAISDIPVGWHLCVMEQMELLI